MHYIVSKFFAHEKRRNVILTARTRTYVINALLLFVEGLAEEMQDSSSVNCLAQTASENETRSNLVKELLN